MIGRRCARCATTSKHSGSTTGRAVVSGDALVLVRGLDGDLVLADPPYGFDSWDDLLGAVGAPFVVAETGRPLGDVDGWSILRSKRYGRTWVTFFERDPGIITEVDQRK